MSGNDLGWLSAELQAEFHQRLVTDRAALAAAWERAQASEFCAAALAELAAIAHKLAGLGQTFGHPEVTATGRALEVGIDRRSAGPVSNDTQLAELVSKFQAAIEAGIGR